MMMQGLARRPFKDIKRGLVADFERRYLNQLLEQHGFNLAAVERSSGLSRKHISALIHKHGLYKRVLHARIGSLIKLLP
jgi:DNA-binding NtrC family response regulator